MDTKDKYGIKIPISGSLIPEVRVWYNPEMKTRNYMVPGIMGLILMITTLSLMSMAVVREKEIGTLEQLIVTPLKPYQLLLGKLIPYTLVGFIVLFLSMLNKQQIKKPEAVDSGEVYSYTKSYIEYTTEKCLEEDDYEI